MLTIVPSKKGYTFNDQPFRLALCRGVPLRPRLHETLRFVPGSSVPRRGYNSDAFGKGAKSVKGKRVALLEDTWVTGATAVSAAGALLNHGAQSVAILPVARMIEEQHFGGKHEYCLASRQPYDPAKWPR